MRWPHQIKYEESVSEPGSSPTRALDESSEDHLLRRQLEEGIAPMKELGYPDPMAENPEGDRDYDTDGRTCRQDVVAKEQ